MSALSSPARVTIVACILIGGFLGGFVVENSRSPFLTLGVLAACVMIFGVLPIVIAERVCAQRVPQASDRHRVVIGLGGEGFRAICTCGWRSVSSADRDYVVEARSEHRHSHLRSVP